MPQSTSVKVEGRPIQLTFTTCRVYMAGEFAGNVELDIECDPSSQASIEECLRLQIPGENISEALIARGTRDGGFSLVFHSDAVERLASVPDSLTLLWCEEPVASIGVDLADSVPLERNHSLVDPAQILVNPEIPTSNVVRLTVDRQPVWLFPAFLLCAVGAALTLAPDGMQLESIPYRLIGGPVMIALGAALGAVGSAIPHRQIWYDRARRQLLFVEGRMLSTEKALAGARHRDLDEFSHVRVCERHYAPEIGDDDSEGREEWLVSLEGPIPYAHADGHVHSRSDALPLARFGSGRRAQRCAAEVGHLTGLRILEATDW